MDNGLQAYHRSAFRAPGNERMRVQQEDVEPFRSIPSLILRESELLYVSEPEQLLRDYMKIRNWKYKLDVYPEGNVFRASVDIEGEDVFMQMSSNQKKALIKVIIYVIYHYNSMLASIWISRHQNSIKDFIR